MKKYIILFQFIFLCVAAGSAQGNAVTKAEMSKVFEHINTWFRATPCYSLNIVHASYKDYTTDVPEDKSNGYFKKDHDNYHSFLIGLHTVQNANYKFVLDTAEKMILVANPDQLAWSGYSAADYEYLMKHCTSIHLVLKGKDKLYRLELPSSSQITAYEFLINPDGLPKEIVWYYNQIKDEDNAGSLLKPRVSITFSEYHTEKTMSPLLFDNQGYFSKKSGKLVAAGKFSSYKLSDQRLNN